MTFLFDENISPDIVESLRPLDKPVVHVVDVDELGRGALDEDVFDFLEQRPDWVLITQDKKMRRKKHQRQAILDAGLGVFVLIGRAEKSNDALVVLLLQCWPALTKLASQTPRPFIFGISDRRKIEPI